MSRPPSRSPARAPSRRDPPSRTALRALMVVVGVVLFLAYLAAAALVYAGLRALWSLRPDPAVTAATVGVATLIVGYLSYRTGRARLLANLGAVELPRERAPGLYRRFDRLCEEMAVGRPTLLLATLPTPNALALGGRGDVVVVDRRLFDLLSPDELEAILAHELAHLESNDALVQTLGYSFLQTVVGAVMVAILPVVLLLTGVARGVAWIAGRPTTWERSPPARLRGRVEAAVLGVLLVLLLPLFAHSRRREFAADARAAEVTDPVTMARALARLHRAADPTWGLLSPLYTTGDERGPLTRLFSTHPTTGERVRRLLDGPGDGRRVRNVPVE